MFYLLLCLERQYTARRVYYLGECDLTLPKNKTRPFTKTFSICFSNAVGARSFLVGAYFEYVTFARCQFNRGIRHKVFNLWVNDRTGVHNLTYVIYFFSIRHDVIPLLTGILTSSPTDVGLTTIIWPLLT